MISIDNNKYELITILGPTASGKTKLAVELSGNINGEIISADSRQIYKGMDIGTGKDLHEYKIGDSIINYHLIDILDPIKNYSVYQFKNDFIIAFKDVISKGNNPVLCGGTGLYIESVLLDYQLSSTKPNIKLREKLNLMSKGKLLEYFRNLNENLCHEWKKDTKQRIIRGIEIASDGKSENNNKIKMPPFKSYIIGLSIERDKLRAKIKERLESRMLDGMIDEVQKLVNNGLPMDRLNYFGLEYKYVGMYLKKEISEEELQYKLYIQISRFAKKQMTFFRRMKKRGVAINWMEPDEAYEKVKSIN